MKSLSFILTFSFAAIISVHAVSEALSADDPSLREYKKILENYYYLDKQKAGHISCHVSVPQLKTRLDEVRLKSRNELIINENTDDFSITYDHTNGFSLNSPHFNLTFPPDSKFATDKHAEKFRTDAESYVESMISKIEATIQILDDLISSNPEERKNLLLTKDRDAAVASYDEKNNHFKVTYNGTTKKIEKSSPQDNDTATVDYQSLNGKLALAHIAAEVTVGSKKMATTTSVSYQDLGSSFFPAQIVSDIATSDGSTHQPEQQHFEINFNGCTASP